MTHRPYRDLTVSRLARLAALLEARRRGWLAGNLKRWLTAKQQPLETGGCCCWGGAEQCQL